ncbi:MAG: type II toxin-antitoxin system VapC family toxin [Spirochaetales bacterium]|nr:type II toxin-antitoxin system VapC family toxin [Spirochaetales bacterium]
MKYLVDTNVCIFLMKNTYPAMTRRFLSMDPSDFYISSVTLYELVYGAEKSKWGERNRNNLMLFLSPFSIIPFDGNDAYYAGKIRNYLEERGTMIGPYEVQIAAQGLARNLIVLTHNTDEFRRVPELKTEDWVA